MQTPADHPEADKGPAGRARPAGPGGALGRGGLLTRLLPVPLALQIALSLAFVAGVGLLAIGASGALAAGAGALAGKSFVTGDAPGATYTPARCADFLEYHPEAPTCAETAVNHHFDEVVTDRLAAGALGVLVLGGALLVRRTRLGLLGAGVLPEGFTATIGTTAFGLGALGLLALSLPQILLGWPDGAGAFLTGGIASIAPLVAFGISLRRSLVEHAGLARQTAKAPSGRTAPHS